MIGPAAKCRAYGVCMRTLVVAYEYPWPANSGFRQRLHTTLHALSRCGPTELFSITPEDAIDFDEPDPSFGLENVSRVPVRLGGARFGGVAHPQLPLEIPIEERDRVSRALARFTTGAYDLVWCYDVRAWLLAGRPSLAPTVLDLDDLEHYKIRGRLAIDPTDGQPDPPARDRRGPTARSRWRRLPGRAFSQIEALRWDRLYRSVSPQVARTVVCSPLEADRATSSGLQRVAVVSNAYARPDKPVGRVEVGRPPVVLFHGTLRYPPNADAVRWLVDRIAPALRDLVPDARIRIVGLGQPGNMSLQRPPAITMVGPVPDIVTELRRADMVVVPIRFGSGTRVKIIEAFAHRIPVVSTTLGAEGLGVEDGRHLLLADTAQGLAASSARLLNEPDLRRRLVDAAHQLYLDAFERGVIEGQVAEIALTAVAGEALKAP
jgi:glycosyltransferase involved in cell wall biosynthesis